MAAMKRRAFDVAGTWESWLREQSSRSEIEAKRSPSGGWTRAQLAEWGVPWPPPKGWKRALEHGLPVV